MKAPPPKVASEFSDTKTYFPLYVYALRAGKLGLPGVYCRCRFCGRYFVRVNLNGTIRRHRIRIAETGEIKWCPRRSI